MILYLEFRNGRQRIGFVSDKDATFFETAYDRGEFRALDEARRRATPDWGTPTAVVAAVFPDGSPDVSWSTVRAAVAMANALAFAWHVPAVGLRLETVPTAETAEAIRLTAQEAAPDARLVARYGGDPHITAPKGDR